MNPVFRSRDERGAVLVHAAILLLGLTAFSALVFDLGVMFVSRRQAQNSADAGALAAATSLAFVSGVDQALASNSATAAATQNLVWGETPGIDVQFACPPGTAGTCARVNVRRTSYEGGGGNALPTFFANIVGITEQGTRAMATAQPLARAGTADCVKPWAIADWWTENNEAPGPTNTFTRYAQPGPGFVPTPDTYTAPGPGIDGTGFTLPADFGRELRLNTVPVNALPAPPASRNALYPVRLPGSVTLYGDAIVEPCGTSRVNIFPDINPPLAADPFGNLAATIAGANNLIGQDPAATWSVGLRAPTGGCMAAGTCTRSPRLVAVILFNPDIYDAGRGTNPVFSVSKIAGFWIESVAGTEVVGYLAPYPTVSLTGPTLTEQSSFARTVVLIR